LSAGDRDNRELWPRGPIRRIRDQLRDLFEEAEFLHSLTADEPTPGAGQCFEPAWALGKKDKESVESSPGSAYFAGPLREDWNWSRAPMVTLLQLAQEFDTAFAEVKRELGGVDFHDLEQFSLRLLWGVEVRQLTRLPEHWRRKLRLIFVDEYQDINAAQDTILRALAREGAEANRFLVGDVKQSIYRFRLADPHIFQSYVQSWQVDRSA